MRSMAIRTCPNGHRFVKNSDCPVCPACEALRKPADVILSKLAAPARRALENNDITKPEQLSFYNEKEVLQFHGLGKSSLPILREWLKTEGKYFKS
jgi:hypothetical protein